MSKPVMCLCDISRGYITIEKDGKTVNDGDGNPILIKALTPVFTESREGKIEVVVYNGYKGIAFPFIKPFGMITTTEKDGTRKTEGLLKLRKDPENDDWVLSSTGKIVTVGVGTLVAILDSRILYDARGSRYVMVRIGIHSDHHIYDGWIREIYIERFYRQ